MKHRVQGRRVIYAASFELPGLLAFWDRYPTIATAVRAAIAVGVAWLVVLQLPAPVSDYPAYAPMGAVIATATNPTTSISVGLRTVAAILAGAALAVAVHYLGPPDSVWIIMLGVALAVLLARWSIFGDMSAWVPTSTIFTLLFGGGEPGYLMLYAGVVLLGAVMGTVVTTVIPGQPLVQVYQHMHDLRRLLAQRTRRVAAAMGDAEQSTDADAGEDSGVRQALESVRQRVSEAEEARRGNWRLRTRISEIDVARRQFTAWERAALSLDLLEGALPARRRVEVLPAVLNQTLDLLESFAEVVESTEQYADQRLVRQALRSIEALEEGVALDVGAGSGLPATAAVALSRCLEPLLLAPTDPHPYNQTHVREGGGS